MTFDDLEEIVEGLFQPLLPRYQIDLKTQMRGNGFIFGCVNLMHYKCLKISFKCGGSYIDSPHWIKVKKATINPKNDAYQCFHHVATVTVNHEIILKE